MREELSDRDIFAGFLARFPVCRVFGNVVSEKQVLGAGAAAEGGGDELAPIRNHESVVAEYLEVELFSYLNSCHVEYSSSQDVKEILSCRLSQELYLLSSWIVGADLIGVLTDAVSVNLFDKLDCFIRRVSVGGYDATDAIAADTGVALLSAAESDKLLEECARLKVAHAKFGRDKSVRVVTKPTSVSTVAWDPGDVSWQGGDFGTISILGNVHYGSTLDNHAREMARGLFYDVPCAADQEAVFVDRFSQLLLYQVQANVGLYVERGGVTGSHVRIKIPGCELVHMDKHRLCLPNPEALLVALGMGIAQAVAETCFTTTDVAAADLSIFDVAVTGGADAGGAAAAGGAAVDGDVSDNTQLTLTELDALSKGYSGDAAQIKALFYQDSTSSVRPRKYAKQTAQRKPKVIETALYIKIYTYGASCLGEVLPEKLDGIRRTMQGKLGAAKEQEGEFIVEVEKRIAEMEIQEQAQTDQILVEKISANKKRFLACAPSNLVERFQWVKELSNPESFLWQDETGSRARICAKAIELLKNHVLSGHWGDKADLSSKVADGQGIISYMKEKYPKYFTNKGVLAWKSILTELSERYISFIEALKDVMFAGGEAASVSLGNIHYILMELTDTVLRHCSGAHEEHRSTAYAVFRDLISENVRVILSELLQGSSGVSILAGLNPSGIQYFVDICRHLDITIDLAMSSGSERAAASKAADLDSGDAGDTLLHVLVRAGTSGLMRLKAWLLWMSKLDNTVKIKLLENTYEGHTLLSFAVARYSADGSYDVVDALCKSGSKPLSGDPSALQLAVSGNHDLLPKKFCEKISKKSSKYNEILTIALTLFENRECYKKSYDELVACLHLSMCLDEYSSAQVGKYNKDDFSLLMGMKLEMDDWVVRALDITKVFAIDIDQDLRFKFMKNFLSWARDGVAGIVEALPAERCRDILDDFSGTDFGCDFSSAIKAYYDSYRQRFILAANTGNAALIRELLRQGSVKINEKTSTGNTALMAASHAGKRDIVSVLLGQDGIDINAKDNKGRTALMHAAEKGNFKVAVVLLSNIDIKINEKDKDGHTALVFAANAGKCDMVRVLLGQDAIDINAKSNHGLTALMIAAHAGEYDMVRVLLVQYRIDINARMNKGYTALMLATKEGKCDVVNLLVGHDDIDINAKDDVGATALMIAAEYGWCGVVERLLCNIEIDINAKSNPGPTALMFASKEGKCDVVKLLLGQDGIDINEKCNAGFTALHHASRAGKCDVLRLLLGQDGININEKSNLGLTALMIAAELGKCDMVKLLLINEEIEINAKDDVGATALMIAAQFRQCDVVEALLRNKETDINAKDHNGVTALMIASHAGKCDVVRVLLGRDDIDLNAKSKPGYTALMVASEAGKCDAVSVLLGRDDIDLNAKDRKGRTALMSAAEKGKCDVVKLLLINKEIEINAKDDVGATALMIAAQFGQCDVVEALLRNKETDINAKGHNGVTALMIASRAGECDVVRLLLGQDDIDINAEANTGVTALMTASHAGKCDVVRVLLGRDDIDLNAKSKPGYTALMVASEAGKCDAVSVLLGRDDIDLNAKDRKGRTALMFAAEKGKCDVVRLLLGQDGIDISEPITPTICPSAAATKEPCGESDPDGCEGSAAATKEPCGESDPDGCERGAAFSP